MTDIKQLDNVEYINYWRSVVTKDATCTCKINSRIPMVKQNSVVKKTLFTRKLGFNVRKKLVKFYIWSITLWNAKTWTLRKVDQKYFESFEMCIWRRMNISWTDGVESKEVLYRVKEEGNIPPTIKRSKVHWIGRILCKNCLLKHTVEGKIEEE